MKKPTRKETQAKQQQLADLRNLAKHRQFLPPEGNAGLRLILTSSGVIVALPPVPELDPRIAASVIGVEGRAFAEYVAGAVGVEAIHKAAAEYKGEYDRAISEACAGFDAEDVTPLCRNLALFGFALLEDAEIFARVQECWLEAKEGKKESAQRLENVLAALSVGSGRYKTLTEEERETIIAYCEKWRTLCEDLNEEFKGR